METLIELMDTNFPEEINTYSKKNQTVKRRINVIFSQIMSRYHGEKQVELIELLLNKINRLHEEGERLLSTNEVDLILGNIVTHLETAEVLGGRRRKRNLN